MANCPTWIAVVVAPVLFAGLASAQVGGDGGGGGTPPSGPLPLVCFSAPGPYTPHIRLEGYTELVADIVIVCTGGTATPNGTAIPRTNLVVSLPAAVTSRILGASDNRSEAMLLIDEPGSGLISPLSGYGPSAPQIPCTDPADGSTCVNNAATISGYSVMQKASDSSVGYNVFQGIVSANQVTFYGVPVLPPATNGVSRVYRIVNIRINASTLAAPATTVTATLSSNGDAAFPLTNSSLPVAYAQPSLSASVRDAKTGSAAYRQWTSVPASAGAGFNAATATAATLRFSELSQAAFRPRVAPPVNTAYAAQAQNLTGQNIPGAYVNSANYPLWNCESGFIASYYSGTSGAGASYAGLVDYGTRLKAVFTNVPAGVHIYVATSNIGAPGFNLGGTSTTSYARLVTGEAGSDGAGSVPLVGGATLTYGSFHAVEITLDSNRSGSAVWEVLNSNANGFDTIDVPVFISYTSDMETHSPALGTAQITLGYAPAPTAAFSAAEGAAASRLLLMPRFSDLSTPAGLFQIAGPAPVPMMSTPLLVSLSLALAAAGSLLARRFRLDSQPHP